MADCKGGADLIGHLHSSMNEECVDRIAELQAVEQVITSFNITEIKKISELLRESGLAIQCLSPGDNIQTRKDDFEKHAEAFACLLEVYGSFGAV